MFPFKPKGVGANADGQSVGELKKGFDGESKFVQQQLFHVTHREVAEHNGKGQWSTKETKDVREGDLKISGIFKSAKTICKVNYNKNRNNF